jgi:hypothetical protein
MTRKRHRKEQAIAVLKDTQAGIGGLRALPQARHLVCHLIIKGGRMRRSGNVNSDKTDQSERTAV